MQGTLQTEKCAGMLSIPLRHVTFQARADFPQSLLNRQWRRGRKIKIFPLLLVHLAAVVFAKDELHRQDFTLGSLHGVDLGRKHYSPKSAELQLAQFS
jgi:hypothetical protein